ncbi:PepSY domain-containing protein [Arenimonas daejeonensis]|uniref:PepSY domain-containing protein n=1 Tax=Arenimonas daejeonensis TaxID=370777 RepID=UPI0011BEABF8|nr:PepSY domain-containing protein [Arenimonas daejeonensis]
MNKSLLTAALVLAGLGNTAFAAVAAGPNEITDTLRAAGYAEVRELEYDDGLWEAEVRRANGLWGEVSIDPANGEVFDAASARPLIDLPQVLASLERAGYQQVHDVDRDGALWDADAYDARGQRVELRISGYDGRIVTVRADNED